MPELKLRFGPMLPDQPGFDNPGIVQALNLIPRARSYGPTRELTVISSNALSERAQTTVTARDASGNVYVYVGTASAIYEMVDQTFTDESKGGGYSTAAGDSWEAVVWGANQKIIFTNYTDAVQSMTIGGGASGAFADMITSTLTPKAKHIGVIGQFVVLGYTNDGTDGEQPERVWWSGINDETDFDPSAATQCDFEDLGAGGVVTRIIGGTEYGLIFQREMVRVMRYVGGATIFELPPINYVPGTPYSRSLIPYFGKVFYISEAGFMALDGVTPQHIGNDRVDRLFLDQFDPGNDDFLSAAIDPVNKIVAWAFPGEGASQLPNKILMCKYDDLTWSEAELDIELLMTTATQGYTLDGLDTLGTDIDDSGVFDESFDSDKWKGDVLRYGAFDQTHQLAYFTGNLRNGTIVTGDLQPVPGRRWQINAVRPLLDGGDAAASVASRTRLRDSLSYGSAIAMNTDGLCMLRSEGRYQRVRLSLSASTTWSHIQGVDIEFVLTGNR